MSFDTDLADLDLTGRKMGRVVDPHQPMLGSRPRLVGISDAPLYRLVTVLFSASIRHVWASLLFISNCYTVLAREYDGCFLICQAFIFNRLISDIIRSDTGHLSRLRDAAIDRIMAGPAYWKNTSRPRG